jgi:sugar transferase EpsL
MRGLAVPSKAFSSLAVGSAIIAICGEESELADVVHRFDCGWVVPPEHPDQLESLLRRIGSGEVDLAPVRERSRAAAEAIGSRANSAAMVAVLVGAAGIATSSPRLRGESSRFFAKRCFDLFVALAGIIGTAPLMAVIWGILRVALGSPVLFRQQRPGLHGQPFMLYKFRTMREDQDANGELLPDAARLGRVGRFVRRTSLDELPSLFNVVKGEMSLVGPRPLLTEYMPLYSPRQARRHEVLPGLTGWAQINGRNSLGWEERLEMDVWYVENRSLRLDLEILLRTVGKVLRSEGISHPRHATMEKFRGSH